MSRYFVLLILVNLFVSTSSASDSSTDDFDNYNETINFDNYSNFLSNVNAYGNINITYEYMKSDLDKTWFYDDNLNDGYINKKINLNLGASYKNIYSCVSFSKDKLEAINFNYSQPIGRNIVKVNLGTHTLIDGFFNSEEALNTSGIIFLPSGVYNNMFTRGIANQYSGAKITADFAISNYKRIDFYYGFGKSVIDNQKITQLSLSHSYSDSIKVAPYNTYEYGVNFKTFSPYNMQAFYRFDSIGFKVDLDKSLIKLTEQELIMRYLSGDKLIAYAYEKPYKIDIHRIGYKFETTKYQGIFEGYYLKPYSKNPNLNPKGSKGVYILLRRFINYNKDIFASYSISQPDHKPYNNNTEVSVGFSYSYHVDLTFVAQVSHFNSTSWQEIYPSATFDDRKDSFTVFGVGFTYVLRMF